MLTSSVYVATLQVYVAALQGRRLRLAPLRSLRSRGNAPISGDSLRAARNIFVRSASLRVATRTKIFLAASLTRFATLRG